MSQPSKPDGTDPRIVVPTEDEETVLIAHGYSTGKTYHTSTCPTVKRMDEPHEVPMSVAEWKDYTKCKRCDEREGGEGYDHPGKGPRNGANIGQLLVGVDAIACLQIRALLLGGDSQADVADRLNIGDATVGRHARGECDCDNHGRPLTYNGSAYHVVNGEGVPKHITGYAPIPERTCRNIRCALVREGVTAARLADVLGVSEDSIRHHGKGECDHCGVTPATYDHDNTEWVMEGAE